MHRPVILDLFCGAGGAAVGYCRAGFHVVGIDQQPQPHYPFEFHQLDWLTGLRRFVSRACAIHASPPCQRFSIAANINGAGEHPDLVGPVRELLEATGKPFVIENVPGAPLRFPATVCGLALGLGVKRHRLFESNRFLFGTTCPEGHRKDNLSVFGHGAQRRVGGKGWVTVYGGGAPKVADKRRRASSELAKLAMGIDWMSRDELSQAIPPAYTEFIGRQLISHLSL